MSTRVKASKKRWKMSQKHGQDPALVCVHENSAIGSIHPSEKRNLPLEAFVSFDFSCPLIDLREVCGIPGNIHILPMRRGVESVLKKKETAHLRIAFP